MSQAQKVLRSKGWACSVVVARAVPGAEVVAVVVVAGVVVKAAAVAAVAVSDVAG